MSLSGAHQADAPIAAPMLTVASVARRLGVAPPTLRTWDRRYGLGPSAHTAGAHRRYGPQDLARLVVMRRLTLDGVPPAVAAQLALQDHHGVVTPEQPTPAGAPAVSVLPGLETSTPDSGRRDQGRRDSVSLGLELLDTRTAGRAPITVPPADREAGAQQGPPAGTPRFFDPSARARWNQTHRRHGGGRVYATSGAPAQARGLARAAMALDTHEAHRLLRSAVSDAGVLATWEHLIVPVLAAIGDRWSRTGEGIEVEHSFAEVVLGVMRGVCAEMERAQNLRPVLLSCAEGDHHTLPLHALAAALAETGIGTRILGSGIPAQNLVASVRRCGPEVVFLFARLPVQDTTVLEQLPRQRPAPLVIVGGPGWERCALPGGAVQVPTLTEAVSAVVAAVRL